MTVIVVPNPKEPLQARAARLWPDNPALQQRWLRAVAMARATRRGWLGDPINPKEPRHAPS